MGLKTTVKKRIATIEREASSMRHEIDDPTVTSTYLKENLKIIVRDDEVKIVFWKHALQEWQEHGIKHSRKLVAVARDNFKEAVHKRSFIFFMLYTILLASTTFLISTAFGAVINVYMLVICILYAAEFIIYEACSEWFKAVIVAYEWSSAPGAIHAVIVAGPPCHGKNDDP